MDTRRSESALNSLGGHASIEARSRLDKGVYLPWVKPLLDRIVGVLLLAVFLPLFLVLAGVVALSIGVPVFYSQTRIGYRGLPFQIYKFRTMHPDRRKDLVPFEGDERRFNHKAPNDPRHTAIGRVLRASRLDELPQLWNVVKGDMSLVGPRPEVPSEVAKYEDWQHRRHVVKPGITGLWQISEQNGAPMRECTELDLEYLERIGFFADMGILLRTPLAMLGKKRGR